MDSFTGTILQEVPIGTYKHENYVAEVLHQKIELGKTYLFTIYDQYGDGITNQGYYHIYYQPSSSSSSSSSSFYSASDRNRNNDKTNNKSSNHNTNRIIDLIEETAFVSGTEQREIFTMPQQLLNDDKDEAWTTASLSRTTTTTSSSSSSSSSSSFYKVPVNGYMLHDIP